MKAWRIGAVALAAVLASTAASATVIDLDLNDFYAEGIVNVTPDGSSAQLIESEEYYMAMVSNDPAIPGDPILIVPNLHTVLAFDYEFEEAVDNDDIFSIYLIDPVNGPLAPGEPFTLDLDYSSGGTVFWDLDSLAGSSWMGIGFALSSGDLVTGSVANISNVRLIVETNDVVPEPATLSLLGLGLAAFPVRYLRRRRN